MDVWIRSSGSDTLSDFSFDFQIVPLGDTATQLRFSNPHSDFQLNNLSYVFASNSLKRDGDTEADILPAPVGTVSTRQFENDTYIGSDSATPFQPPGSVTLGMTHRLLAFGSFGV